MASITPPWLNPDGTPTTYRPPVDLEDEKALDEIEEVLGPPPPEESPALQNLPPRIAAFVEEYCTGRTSGKAFRKAAAAHAAGWSEGNSPKVAWQLMRRPEVKAAIAARLRELSMTKEEVVAQITEIAREADISMFVRIKVIEVPGKDGDPPTIIQRLEIDPEAVKKYGHLVKSVGYDSNGNPKIELHDRAGALRDLGKAHGVFKEGVELSGPGGAALPLQMTINFVHSHNGRPADQAVDNPPLLESGD